MDALKIFTSNIQYTVKPKARRKPMILLYFATTDIIDKEWNGDLMFLYPQVFKVHFEHLPRKRSNTNCWNILGNLWQLPGGDNVASGVCLCRSCWWRAMCLQFTQICPGCPVDSRGGNDISRKSVFISIIRQLFKCDESTWIGTLFHKVNQLDARIFVDEEHEDLVSVKALEMALSTRIMCW